MKLYLKTITAILAGSLVYSTSALAAYGPAPAPKVHKPSEWSISAGYGQTFGHDKGSITAKDYTFKTGSSEYKGVKYFDDGSPSVNQPDDDTWGLRTSAYDLTNSSGLTVISSLGAADGEYLFYKYYDEVDWSSDSPTLDSKGIEAEMDGFNSNDWESFSVYELSKLKLLDHGFSFRGKLYVNQGIDNKVEGEIYELSDTPFVKELVAHFFDENEKSFDLEIDHIKLYEVDIFHSSGFGAVFMGSAEDAKLTSGADSVGTYNFNAIMAGYKMALGDNMSARVAVGQANQEYKLGDINDIKLDDLTANVEAKYHFDLSDNMSAFVAAGYLHLKELDQEINSTAPVIESAKLNPSAGYWKVGVAFTM